MYSVVFEPDGLIGPHVTRFGQLFLPLLGSGWVAGKDGRHVEVSPGTGGYIARGEVHSKGSQEGMMAVMIQVHDLVATDESLAGTRDPLIPWPGHRLGPERARPGKELDRRGGRARQREHRRRLKGSGRKSR